MSSRSPLQPPRPGRSSSPSDTRSRAASDLTEQGLENQRPDGERNDPSSVVQPGSSRDGRTRQPPSGQKGRERSPPDSEK